MGHTFDGSTLKEIISALEAVPDKERIVKVGWKHPHSYRGYYEDLAFEKAEGVSLQSMLDCAKSALGQTFGGWKGGEYHMDEDVCVWLTEEEGSTGHDLIGPLLLAFIVGQPSALEAGRDD